MQDLLQFPICKIAITGIDSKRIRIQSEVLSLLNKFLEISIGHG